VAGPVDWQDWALGGGGLYYAKTRYRVPLRRSELAIQYLDFGSNRTTTLFRKEGGAAYLSLTVSPDEKWILFGEVPAWQSELMLLENFR
jgi:hypothetical protein